nr:putative reverse transcriptase domain, viral movement protein [Tanacetum cinerariifolium]
MKCCSFQKKDLEKHYDRMSQLFYYLNRVDDVNLKQVFLNSFLESLGNEAYRALEKKFLAEFERTGKCLRTTCDDKYMPIKYDEPSDSVLYTIAYSDFSSDENSNTDSLESDSDFGVHVINPILHVLPIQEDPPLPLAKIHLFTDAYAKPIPIIVFFDIDVNPTKASHPEMNTDHYQLAKEEREQLVSQGIIEPTTSPWACEDFYVNNRSEQVRRKLRLVIYYQPLNHFLANDKFPLPQKKPLFQHLADARVLSKFDLKFVFWQLCIKPKDRPKTAFCIPDHHYQWKKKMEVGVTIIQFLGMEITNEKYQPQPHVAQELLKFPDELSSQKMIQQFLGLVNYMADFLPKLSHYTAWLFLMLKKNLPQWTSRQTEAVKVIKSLAEKMPPLKIPASLEKRILQTDASDECWEAVLLVQDNNNKRHVCGYKSGTFKASEQHYHFTFKEIFTVK